MKKNLDDKKPEGVWSMLIAESANYYLGTYAGIGEREHYRIIGQKMWHQYSCIGLEGGKEPWSTFSKSLSQKIRHIRHKIKRKSAPETPGTAHTSTRKRVCTFSVKDTVSDSTSEEDVQRHLKEIKSEWEKPLSARKNYLHMKTLLLNTRQHRVSLLQKHSNGRIKPLHEAYPCFEDSAYVLQDFKFKCGSEKTKEAAQNLKKFIVAVEEIMSVPKQEGRLRLLPVIQFIEKQTKRKEKGVKNHKHKTIIEVKTSVDASGISKALETEEGDPLHIVAFMSNDQLEGLFIVGDGTTSTVKVEAGLIAGVFHLLVAYYVYDVEYPRCFAMVLGMLQTFVMGEPYDKPTSTRYQFLSKRIRNAYDQPDAEPLPSEENDN